MPHYRLVDQETGESVALRRMSHDAANLLNAELGDDQQWKRGLQHEKTSSPPIGTLHQITRSLDTEGFNQHSLQVIERFLNHHSFILAKHRQAFRRLKKRFAAFMRPCPENERQMVGRFIAAQCGHSFEAGLRLGMTGCLMDVDDANDSEEGELVPMPAQSVFPSLDLSHCQTVPVTPLSRSVRAASRRRVQWSCPAGGGLQARAIRWASPRSSSFRRRLASARGGEAVAGIQAFTKWVPRPGPMTRQVVENNIDISRRRMGMNRLDLLQFHWWDYRESAYLETLTHLSDLRDEGKIQELALTNFDTQRMQEIAGQGIRVVSNQVQYSLVDRRPEVAMVGFCQSHEVSLLAYGTLCCGLLSDLYLGRPKPTTAVLNTASLRKYKQMIDARGRLEPISAVAGRAQDCRRQAQRQHRQRRGAICPGPSGRRRRHHWRQVRGSRTHQ